ncbi:MAG: hypothetical protein ACR2HE_04740 [Casimicrobiaceae bacterium]
MSDLDDREREIELTLERLRLGDSFLELAAMIATFAWKETKRQCTEGQRLARIVRVLDAEASQRATDAVETVA